MKYLILFWKWIVRLFSPAKKQVISNGFRIPSSKKLNQKRGKLHRAMKNSKCCFASTKGFAL